MLNWLRSHRPASATLRARLGVEAVEDRLMPMASPFDAAPATVYVESNDPDPGRNAVLAYRRDPDGGGLRPIGAFPTGGTGQLNVPKLVGPDDGDQQVRATADGRFLYAVNEGSGTVAAFRVRPDGRLERVGVFASGGVEPDSIGIAGDHLYVANRGDAAAGVPGTVAPNVTGFTIGRDGGLAPIPGSTVSFPVGTFVTQTLISRDGRFLFAEAATLQGTPGGNTITPFRVGADGRLDPAPGGPAGAGADAPLLLGSAAHPELNIIYTGFASSSQVGVFTYDETGRTSYVGPTPDRGAAPCWCVVSPDGRYLYVANTLTDSVGVYSLADPLHPAQVQEFQLGGPRSLTADPTGPRAFAFEIALDPTGRTLYALSQASDPAFPQGNQLHALAVARDGTLSEPTGPVIFPQGLVPADAHPQGVAVVGPGGRDRDDGWADRGPGVAWFDAGDPADGPGRGVKT